MKVLNLQCQHGHAFEGWFASHEDYTAQQERGLLTCPVCNDVQIVKLPSAPRLNLGASAPDAAQSAADSLAGQGSETIHPMAVSASHPHQALTGIPPRDLQAVWMKMVRHVITHTEDVGGRFAEEARKIHHGEAPHRGIRGQASRAETEALLDEGIDILPLPIPPGLKETLQ